MFNARSGLAAVVLLALAAAVAAGVAGVAGVAGCSSSGGSSSRDAAARGATVTIQLTSAGCAPRPARIPAGPVQFNISNKGAGAVSEAELRTSDLAKILGEQENLVAFHAVRNLARTGMGVVEHHWMELGFGRTSATTTGQRTPRNLLGFKDGTRNIRAEQTGLMDDYVWAGRETDQPWLRGGSYLVARKIRPAGAHIRLASPEHNGGTRILRRGYSFTDGIDPQAGTLLGGLFFIAFMKNPAQFVRLQRSLAADALGEYIQHTGSAVFACPPGIGRGQHWGQGLLA